MIVSTATIDEVVEETNELLPLAIAQATPPHDVATSMMAIARAVGLYLATGDAADARQAGLLAAARAEPGTAVHSLAVSWLAWLGYLEDTESERSPSTARADALPDNGMPDVAIAQTLADQATTDARAHRLVVPPGADPSAGGSTRSPPSSCPSPGSRSSRASSNGPRRCSMRVPRSRSRPPPA